MKKYIKVLLVLLLFIATPVFAASDSLYQAEDNFVVDKDLDGTSFIAGYTVETKNNINGMLFMAGNTVNVYGKSDYSFIAGNTVKVKNANFKDGFIAGNIVEINESNIERDLYIASSRVTIKSNIGRDLRIASGDVEIDSTINGNVTVYASNITINSNARINGTLTYDESSKVIISKDAVINNTVIEKNKNVNISKLSVLKTLLLNSLYSYINILLVAFVLILIAPKLFDAIKEKGTDSILSSMGYGLLALFFVPVVAFLVMVSTVGLSLGLLLVTFYIISLYISTIISAMYYGNMLFKDKINNKYALVAVSLLIIYILKLIPFISTLTSIIVLCSGLGLILSLIIKRNRQ